MDRGGKYLPRGITKFTVKRKYFDQNKTEDTRQSKGEKSRKRTTKTKSNDVKGGIIGYGMKIPTHRHHA